MMPSGFRWTTFDLTSSLSRDWQQEIAATAADADFREFPRTPILSREGRDVQRVYRGRVHAAAVRTTCPGCMGSTGGDSSTSHESLADQPVMAAHDDRYGVVLNVQRGTKMRFECHVDSNPLPTCCSSLIIWPGGGELLFPTTGRRPTWRRSSRTDAHPAACGH